MTDQLAVTPDQQVLDIQIKLVHHAIKIAAFNSTTAIARDVLDASTLTIRLDTLPTARETAAVAALCTDLTATATTYPGTDLTLRYEIEKGPKLPQDLRTMLGVLGPCLGEEIERHVNGDIYRQAV